MSGLGALPGLLTAERTHADCLAALRRGMSAAEIEEKLEVYRASLMEEAATAQRQKAAASSAAERRGPVYYLC